MKLANVVCGLALALSTVAPAKAAQHAISEAQAKRLQHTFTVLQSGHVKNLLQIGTALGGVQRDATQEITSYAGDANETVGALLDLATIYQRMACAADKAQVLSWLPESLRHAKNSLDIDLEGINQTLAQFTNQAALSEAQVIRDKLREVREELDQYSY